MFLIRALRRQGPAAVVLALATAVAVASPASAAETTLNFACRAQAPIIGPQDVSVSQSVDVDAPESVGAGDRFDIVVTSGPTEVPATINGIRVRQIRDVALTVPIPDNATFVSADVSGGDNLGGEPTVEVQGDEAVVRFPGPVAGGSSFTLPTVTLGLTAGEAGSTIVSRLGGTGVSDPDLTFVSTGSVGFDIDAPTRCFADPSPDLATTSVT